MQAVFVLVQQDYLLRLELGQLAGELRADRSTRSGHHHTSIAVRFRYGAIFDGDKDGSAAQQIVDSYLPERGNAFLAMQDLFQRRHNLHPNRQRIAYRPNAFENLPGKLWDADDSFLNTMLLK